MVSATQQCGAVVEHYEFETLGADVRVFHKTDQVEERVWLGSKEAWSLLGALERSGYSVKVEPLTSAEKASEGSGTRIHHGLSAGIVMLPVGVGLWITVVYLAVHLPIWLNLV